jgi:hypothetical protein
MKSNNRRVAVLGAIDGQLRIFAGPGEGIVLAPAASGTRMRS